MSDALDRYYYDDVYDGDSDGDYDGDGDDDSGISIV